MALFKDLNLPVSSRMGRRGFYVPSGLGLSVEEIERVSEQVTLILTSGYRS
jgi:perosamine synthetase